MKQKKLLVSMFLLLFCGTLVCATKSQAKILTIKHSTKNVYTTKYQREATSYLTKWKKGKRTLDAPLLVKNPYGTLSTSIYFYAVSTEPLYAKYTITAKGAETISGTLAGGSEANVPVYLFQHSRMQFSFARLLYSAARRLSSVLFLFARMFHHFFTCASLRHLI